MERTSKIEVRAGESLSGAIARTQAENEPANLRKQVNDIQRALDDAQAQLRQVEGERDRLTQQLHTLYAKHPEDSCYGAMPKLRAEVANLRQLVAALPVVKGDVVIEPPWVGQVGGTYDVRVRQQVNNTMTSVRIARFHIKEDAEAFAALLTHRAWMNYATLAAQDPPHPTEERS